MKNFVNDFWAKINERKCSLAVVARETGIQYSRLRTLKERRVEPTVTEFVRLARFCGMNCNEYLFDTQEQKAAI